MIIRSQDQWEALFQQHEDSCMNATAFCKDNKLYPKYFSKRKSVFNWKGAKRVSKKSSSKLVKLSTVKSLHNKNTRSLQLRFKEVKLSLPANQSASWVEELVKAMTL